MTECVHLGLLVQLHKTSVAIMLSASEPKPGENQDSIRLGPTPQLFLSLQEEWRPLRKLKKTMNSPESG